MWKGRVVAIHIHDEAGAPPFAIEEARLVAGQGIEGDANFRAAEKDPGPERADQAVTLIESETVEAVRRDYGLDVTAALTRRNIETEGVPLNHLVGREFRVGTAVCRGVELCEPCGHLEGLTVPGIRKSLLHRGGLRARILTDGVARPGDAVEPHG